MVFSKQDMSFKLIFIVLGLALSALTYLVPLRLIFLLILGLALTIFTFANIKLSLCFFILAMSIIPNSMWSNMFIILAAIFFWGVFAVQFFAGTRKGIDSKFIAPSLILYIIFCIISFFTGFGGLDSIRVASIMFACISLGVLTINIIDDIKAFKLVVCFVFISLFITAIYGLLQYAMGIEIREDFVDLAANQGLPGRLYSTMGNPNNYAKFIVMLLPFCVSYIFMANNQLKKLILTVLIAPIFLALILTFSRASYLALAGAAGMYILLIKPRLIPVGIILFIMCIPFIPDTLIMRMSTIGTDTSSQYRILILEGVLGVIRNYWAQGIGIGPDAFNLIYRAHAHQSAGSAMHAHNVFLNVWVEIGIGGLIAILVYNFKTFRSGVSSLLKADSIGVKYFLAAGVSALTAFLIFSLVEHVWFYPRTMLTYWIMIGLIWSVIRIDGGRMYESFTSYKRRG